MTVAEELRAAAAKLTAEPHCGGEFSDCVCEYSDRIAALLLDVAEQAEQNQNWRAPELLLDMARRINRTEVAA
jgi:hypothetical protein